MSRVKNKGGCPRHGLEYMIRKDNAYYCAYPTPNEIGRLCFCHPNENKVQINTKKKSKKDPYTVDTDPDYQPNVLKAIYGSWERRKYTTRRQNLM